MNTRYLKNNFVFVFFFLLKVKRVTRSSFDFDTFGCTELSVWIRFKAPMTRQVSDNPPTPLVMFLKYENKFRQSLLPLKYVPYLR
jgi:hypothetical protein